MSRVHIMDLGSGLEDTILLVKCASSLSCLIKSGCPQLPTSAATWTPQANFPQTWVVPWSDHTLPFMATLSDGSSVRKWVCVWRGVLPCCPTLLKRSRKNSRTWKYLSFPFPLVLQKKALNPMCILKKTREIKVQSFGVRAWQVDPSGNHSKEQKKHNSSNWTVKKKTILSRLSSWILI